MVAMGKEIPVEVVQDSPILNRFDLIPTGSLPDEGSTDRVGQDNVRITIDDGLFRLL